MLFRLLRPQKVGQYVEICGGRCRDVENRQRGKIWGKVEKQKSNRADNAFTYELDEENPGHET